MSFGFGSGGSIPTPAFKRLMAFLDGENIVFQYQSLLKKGRIPNKTVKHRPNVYAWSVDVISNINYAEIYRATYYTSAVYDDNSLEEILKEIEDLEYQQSYHSALPNRIIPYVLKKFERAQKSKGVDMKMTVDILTNVYQNNTDIIYIATGDGDFLPVIKECQRLGKVIFLAAFEEGLNKKLLHYVDKFIALEDKFFL